MLFSWQELDLFWKQKTLNLFMTTLTFRGTQSPTVYSCTSLCAVVFWIPYSCSSSVHVHCIVEDRQPSATSIIHSCIVQPMQHRKLFKTETIETKIPWKVEAGWFLLHLVTTLNRSLISSGSIFGKQYLCFWFLSVARRICRKSELIVRRHLKVYSSC